MKLIHELHKIIQNRIGKNQYEFSIVPSQPLQPVKFENFPNFFTNAAKLNEIIVDVVKMDEGLSKLTYDLENADDSFEVFVELRRMTISTKRYNFYGKTRDRATKIIQEIYTELVSVRNVVTDEHGPYFINTNEFHKAVDCVKHGLNYVRNNPHLMSADRKLYVDTYFDAAVKSHGIIKEHANKLQAQLESLKSKFKIFRENVSDASRRWISLG